MWRWCQDSDCTNDWCTILPTEHSLQCQVCFETKNVVRLPNVIVPLIEDLRIKDGEHEFRGKAGTRNVTFRKDPPERI